MIAAVLFDLDGTLLDISLDSFFREYFAAVGPVIADLLGMSDPEPGLAALMRGTQAMSSHHPQTTNREVFNRTFEQLTGLDLGNGSVALRLESFYAESFPALKASHGPRPGAEHAVATARELGLKTALATNPIFPLAAIEERARWAGLDPCAFDVVTSYEGSRATKPSGLYFADVAQALDVSVERCLMVGDDPDLDLPAAQTGMRTFYVGDGAPSGADWTGNLSDLARLLPELVA